MPWQGIEQDLELKLERILAVIDTHNADGYMVSLLGTSAGGSAAINAYAMRKNKIHTAINVCGRLRKGKGASPTLAQASQDSKSFYDSVMRCQHNLDKLTRDDSAKILTLRPLFDEVVPRTTVSVREGTNILLPAIGHVLSISIAMTVFSKIIVDFVLKE